MSAKIIPLSKKQIPRVDPGSTEITDDALLASAALGDSHAIAVLFARRHRDVNRFLGRLVARNDVEDLMQSTFLEAWTHADRFRGRSSVRAWLFGIASNLARHHHRKAARRRNAMDLLSQVEPVRGLPTDEQVSNKQLMERVGVALAELPHKLKVAYVMCEIEDLPGTEAARALGVRPGTMWRRLHQARRKLRAAVEEDG